MQNTISCKDLIITRRETVIIIIIVIIYSRTKITTNGE